MVACEPGAGSTKSGIDLVQDQEQAAFGANLPEHREERARRNVDPAPDLDRFDKHSANRAAPEQSLDGNPDGLEISNGRRKLHKLPKTSQLRKKRSPEMVPVRRVQSAISKTMVTATKHDNATLSRGQKSGFQGSFDRLEARIAEDRFPRLRRLASPAFGTETPSLKG